MSYCIIIIFKSLLSAYKKKVGCYIGYEEKIRNRITKKNGYKHLKIEHLMTKRP